ncbi:MAG: glycosyltransferase [Saprospiraceae bacterium]|nr:glycosyltransferase [Saprospiraceae bacterium]
MAHLLPKISVVIPCRNEAKYIAATLAQFEPLIDSYNLEIIVSDGNSIDETAEIVRRFSEKYPGRVIFAQKPGKQNIAIGRNYGASQASGDLLFHTDADVRIPNPERFFQTVRKTFENPQTVAATVPIWIYPEEARIDDKIYHVLMNLVIRLSFFVRVYLAKGECELVRREVFERIGGYSEHLIAGEDCNLFYRLQKEGKIAYLHRLKVYHSPRRFREYGYIRLTLIYFREGLWMLLGRKSYVKEWKAIR